MKTAGNINRLVGAARTRGMPVLWLRASYERAGC